MKLIKLLLPALLALTLLLPAGCDLIKGGGDTATNQMPGQASFGILSPVDGLASRTNVIKVEGTAPENVSAVTINGKPAYVADSAFFGFVELAEGQNTIEAKASISGKMLIQDIKVSFVRPLAVFIHDVIEPGVNYLIEPLTITGFVTLPQASVTVDGALVSVQADGTFTTKVMVNQPTDLIRATALLGTETDTRTLVYLFQDGHLLRGPSYPFESREPELIVGKYQGVTRGADANVDFTLKPNKNIPSPQSCRFIVPGTGGGSIPAGLGFTFYQETFIAYPNASYNLTFSVTASKNITPGNYSLTLEASFAGGTGIIVPIMVTVR